MKTVSSVPSSGVLRWFGVAAVLSLFSTSPDGRAGGDAPVSFHKEVRPILRQNCNGCHRPGKAKGGLDLTTFAALMKGGKNGPAIEMGDPHSSVLVESVSGDEPEMPKEGEPLIKEEIELIQRWIAQGAKDDTPADGATHKLATPPVYRALPAISGLAWSPDGTLFAVSGHHEVLLRSGDGKELIARLVGESPRIESLAFSQDGSLLAVAGGAPSEYGEVQIWDVKKRELARSIKTTSDSVFGVSFSPDGSRVAVGCSDKTVRVFTVSDGREMMKCDNHIDWVFATAFNNDGTRLVSASRDRAVKLIDVATGRLIDDVNRPREGMLSLARHPKDELLVCGDEKGAVRVHKMIGRAGRLKEGDDKEESFVRDLERLSGPVHALAFSPTGETLAAGSASGEVKIYRAGDGNRVATAKANSGPVFALAFQPDGKVLAIGGFDGKVRLVDAASGAEVSAFDPVPLTSDTASASAAR